MNRDENIGSGATGVFGTVPREPAKVETPLEPVRPAAAIVESQPAAVAASGGFTQLLRALNYDQLVKASGDGSHAPSPIEDSTAPDRARASNRADAMPEKRVAPMGSSQVTSFLPRVQPVEASAPAVETPAAAGSFTKLFQKLEPEPMTQSAPSKQEGNPAPDAGSFTQLFAVPETLKEADKPREIEAVPTQDEGGSFTRLFAAVDAGNADGWETNTAPKIVETKLKAEPEPSIEPPRDSLAVRAEIAQPPQSPGSFTQMFQTLGSPSQECGPANSSTGSKPLQVAVMPGAFTQMFQTLGETPATAKADAEKAEPPGSFTQLFGGVSTSQPVVPPSPSSYERPFAASGPDRGESGASQMFATYQGSNQGSNVGPKIEPQAEARVERAAVFSPVEPAPVGRASASATPSSGGLTQLLRALDQPVRSEQPYVPAPALPAMPSPQAGSFTGVYGELGTPYAPVTPAITETSPAIAGPSEFTRLINASALREADLRGGTGVPATAAPATLGSPAAQPAVGGISFAAPALPQAPKIPQIKPPEVPKIAAPAVGLQNFVPLLLILVIFLLVAILVAVVVLMKK